jgi:hypothetical protein
VFIIKNYGQDERTLIHNAAEVSLKDLIQIIKLFFLFLNPCGLLGLIGALN